MARRLHFNEFARALETGSIPDELLPQYLEFDPERAVPRLVFRRDALLDSPPEDYDVDEAVYRLLRARREERSAQAEAFAFAPSKSVLAEGDSWFNLPAFFRPPAIADWIDRHGQLRVRNIARWGHTLARILKEREYMKELAKAAPDFFMFTAGGNDLQEGLESGSYIHEFLQGRPIDQYLTPDGQAELKRIEVGHASVFAEVAASYPNLPILCHGYDYPRPLLGGGTYIGRFLRRKGIPDELMEPILRHIVDQLNAAIKTAASSVGAVRYLDCRRMTDPYTWYDDMHPDRDGFEALAAQFEQFMPAHDDERTSSVGALAYFVFEQVDPENRVHEFVLELADAERIDQARAILADQSSLRVHVQGTIVPEPAWYNSPWSFYLDPMTIGFFEFATEVCDANVTLVQDRLSDVGGSFLPNSHWCPWSSKLSRELTKEEVERRRGG